ncbi:hypothetical protein FA13DRAFT_1723629 [Coprinellus micaceus]|uniref:Uncharacterized protein n=1 Tax=Coprinellus micaceus TaxID=71717 RepID=A0A4Y7TZ37_COPMI|nr:hypothetical protein FA13DRAFT_1723629 [Coprinellus micaceus]
MKFTTTLAVASLLSAVFVSATPIPSEFQTDSVDAREFSDEDVLFERATLGRAMRKAAKDTADIAAQRVYDTATSGGAGGSRRPFLSGIKAPSARPRPGGVRPIKVPGSTIKAPSKPGVNWKGAWDAGKGKKPAGRKTKPVIGRPAKSVPRPGGHAGKPVRMPKKSGRK